MRIKKLSLWMTVEKDRIEVVGRKGTEVTNEKQKTEMIQDSNMSKFKFEVQSSQKHHVSLLQRKTEKFRGDIEKMCNELKYEIDKSFNMSNDKDNFNVADLTTILNDEDRVGLVHALNTKLQSLNGQHSKLLKNLFSTVRKCV
ncbi:hypothetical protein OIU77_030440 [Salix suchowensis]|uniref:Uncharacterized protein n=1 Tax=Salix suchowensis TaxID=1278906 RepID=A0ABQ9BDX8_9ROSI|nr:hypothetical protein OIU77_030440 [Salix suchowensis]